MRNLFKSKTPEKSKPSTVVVVSGLPRSGTSMMMKMLVEGGLQAVTDALRTADEDNPNGYFEFEPVKQLPQGDINWLDNADRKVVKIISQLLEYLPSKHRYKIIFMEREIKEVLASQQKMLTRRDEENRIEDGKMEEQFRDHLSAIKYWLARQPNIDVLYLKYNNLISAPADSCKKLADFLDIPLDTEKMCAVPSEKLYRNRAPS